MNTYITADSESNTTTSAFLSKGTPQPQSLGVAASLNYVYSTQLPLVIANNADLHHYYAVASSGPPYHFPAGGNSLLTVLDFAPNPDQEEGFWHRSQTIDYVVVLKGQVELSLDGGEKKIMNVGDIVVQRACMHKWKNLSKTESARYVTVMIGIDGAAEDAVEYGGSHLG